MPAYLLVASLYFALLSAFVWATWAHQVIMERRQAGMEPHRRIVSRLRLRRVRKMIPSRPARGPRRASTLRRRVRETARRC